MEILKKNIRTNRQFKFIELLLIFNIFLLITSIFSKGIDFKSEKEKSCSIHINQNNLQNKVFQVSRINHESNLLLLFISAEVSETNDDDQNEKKVIESGTPLFLLPSFNYSKSISSFANFSLSLKKRINIPLFLLHQSWKIPSA
jgi:competence protein ComGC